MRGTSDISIVYIILKETTFVPLAGNFFNICMPWQHVP